MEHMEGLCVTGCERCPKLVDSRSRIVSRVGPDGAGLLFLGEAPDAKGDKGGEPSVGHSSSVLDDTLREASLARANVRITNCVRRRPPDSRDPANDKLLNCRGYLARELEPVDPELVVALGKVPSRHLLDRGVAITSESGSVVDARVEDVSYRVLLSVHPVATLYDRSQRKGFFEIITRTVDPSGFVDSTDGQTSLGDF